MTDPTSKDEEAAKVDRFRQRMAAKVAEIQGALMTWLRPRDSEADNVCITNALLNTALDRHVAVHGADSFDLIEAAYRRALERHRGPLQ